MSTTLTCVRPGCDRTHYARGLCYNCYMTALRLVKTGKTTWVELQDNGKCRPANPTIGKTASWMMEVKS